MYAVTEHAIDRRPRRLFKRIRLPSARLEYAYYFAVAYSVLAPALGLDVPVLAGVLIFAVWFFCMFRMQSTTKEVFGPIALLIGCAITFIVVQVAIHDESIMDSDIRAFITWIMGLMIVQALVLRPGFSIRFPIVLFLIGAVTLPFIGFNPGEVDMARVEIAVQGGLTHPEGFAEWFGFSAIFFAIFGIESKRPHFKIGAWGLMVICLLLVTLSVERGPLFATALGLILAFRKSLKRVFMPLLIVTFIVGILSFTGLFEQAISSYSARGMEDTGREILWPAAIERIGDSPIFGEGKSNALIPLSATKLSPPHNSFLYLALSSGIMPLIFFATFWLRISWRTVRQSSLHKNAPFSLPYLGFILPSLMVVDLSFQSISGLLITSLIANASFAKRSRFATSAVRTNRPRRQGYYNEQPTTTGMGRRNKVYGFVANRRQF